MTGGRRSHSHRGQLRRGGREHGPPPRGRGEGGRRLGAAEANGMQGRYFLPVAGGRGVGEGAEGGGEGDGSGWAACAVAWFLVQAVQALPVLEFGDESEHIVVALMVAAGDRLYTNIFAVHGPLAYALSHFWLLLTGSKDLASYRLISLALFALCAAAIYASPVLTQRAPGSTH